MKSNITKLLCFELATYLATTNKLATKDKWLPNEKKFVTNEKF